jgi:hypothetical protein
MRLPAALLLATLPVVALAQTRPPPQQQPVAPPPPTPAETRRAFCDFSGAELDTIMQSINAAFRGRQAAQRDAQRLSGRPGADEARQRAERWGAMITEQLVDLDRWTMVRASQGCPAYGQ